MFKRLFSRKIETSPELDAAKADAERKRHELEELMARMRREHGDRQRAMLGDLHGVSK